MRKPDEIMAEYLLKGGKMLAKTCPDCGSPLFEYKGETFCSVCREDQMDQQKRETTGGAEEQPSKNLSPGEKNHLFQGDPDESLNEAFTLTIRSLLIQARGEQDVRRLHEMTKSIRIAAEAYAILTYGYGNRERS